MNIPQTEQDLLSFVADYLRMYGFRGAACRVMCHDARPLTEPESWEMCAEIMARGIDKDAALLADYLVRLVAMNAWAEIEVGMRTLQSTKSARAACDAIMAHPEGR